MAKKTQKKATSRPAAKPAKAAARRASSSSSGGRAGSTSGGGASAASSAAVVNADPVGSLTDEQLAARIRMHTAMGSTVELFQSGAELYMRVR